MRIGIDLGGTKIEGIALAPDGREMARERIATPRDYDRMIAAIAGLAGNLDKGGKARAGVGIPGAISPATGLVKNANSTWLNGRPLDKDLARALGRPVRLANDANCFALSEAVDGAGAGAQCVFGVILGTGVGGGLVIGGKVHAGRNAIGGEWGHNPLPWPRAGELPGPECWCGKRGCIEMWLSGPAFERDFARRTGRHVSASEIVARAGGDDYHAECALADYEERLARALAHAVNILDPDVIVLGGGMSNTPGLAGRVAPLIARFAFSDSLSTEVRSAAHGDSSGVRGAAWLWEESGNRDQGSGIRNRPS